MALMYDMETVNKAMTEAAKLYDPKHKSAKRVKKVLDIFAAIKPLELHTRHAHWVAEIERMGNYSHCSECGCRCQGYAPNYKYCPGCGARMDGEEVPENGKA